MNIRQQEFPIGRRDFSDLRQRAFLYVDKTSFVADLVSASKYFFLSLPRGFGKTLFLSTLKAHFEGNKRVFKWLYLEKEMGRGTSDTGRPPSVATVSCILFGSQCRKILKSLQILEY
ncbi:MAG: AAA family ATPase [Bacteroides sp.]